MFIQWKFVFTCARDGVWGCGCLLEHIKEFWGVWWDVMFKEISAEEWSDKVWLWSFKWILKDTLLKWWRLVFFLFYWKTVLTAERVQLAWQCFLIVPGASVRQAWDWALWHPRSRAVPPPSVLLFSPAQPGSCDLSIYHSCPKLD